MKSAYLYVRVSTEEQKRKGYSLPEQEDRLLRYCEYNNIKVIEIFREGYSAKILADHNGMDYLVQSKQANPKKRSIFFL